MDRPLTLEPMTRGDWKAVKAIYAEGLATGLAAFMTSPPLWRDWDSHHLPTGRIIARSGGRVAGWVAMQSAADT
ncbi:MAG: GNAT family N-acetyltransferase [Hyphomicrobiaceae bacterium]